MGASDGKTRMHYLTVNGGPPNGGLPPCHRHDGNRFRAGLSSMAPPTPPPVYTPKAPPHSSVSIPIHMPIHMPIHIPAPGYEPPLPPPRPPPPPAPKPTPPAFPLPTILPPARGYAHIHLLAQPHLHPRAGAMDHRAFDFTLHLVDPDRRIDDLIALLLLAATGFSNDNKKKENEKEEAKKEKEKKKKTAKGKGKRGWVVECLEVGDGKWIAGSGFVGGGEGAAQRVGEVGWGAGRGGPTRKPVVLAWGWEEEQ